MGKKKERAVGCVLINDHRKTHKRRDPKKDSWLHTTEMDELPYPGYDAKLDKLKSCTEQVSGFVLLHTTEMDELSYPGYNAKIDKLKFCSKQVSVFSLGLTRPKWPNCLIPATTPN